MALLRHLLPRRTRKLALMVSLILLACFGLLYNQWMASLDTIYTVKEKSFIHQPLPLDAVAWNKLMRKAKSKSVNPGVDSGVESNVTPNVDCTSMPQADYLYCKAGEDPMKRAIDLVERMSLLEVIGQTSSIAPGIRRLGLKDYNWRSNCLHGWSLSGGSWEKGLYWTVFPAPIGLGATFDTDLIKDIGDITSTEGRALHNEMLRLNNGSSTEAAGLNCFSPNVNLLRDPRWGRAQETFGEDPYLISVLGNAYTRGLQEGPDKRYLKVAACAKHYGVHSGPEELRFVFEADVSLHDLYDTYLPAFRSQVMGANVSQIMPAYSGIKCYPKQPNGVPDSASPFLLKTILRGEFGAPNISVCSDNGGISAVYSNHHFVSSNEEGAAVCIKATTDIDLGGDLIYTNFLFGAVVDDLVTVNTIRQSVIRNFYLRMLLGDFDPPSSVPYQFFDRSNLDTPGHKEFNLRAARESIVLLKNLNNHLPLSKNAIHNILVMGPNSNNSQVLLSNYEGIPSKNTTILQAIEEYLKDSPVSVHNSSVCSSRSCSTQKVFASVAEIARNADYIIMVMGLDAAMEAEGFDRRSSYCDNTMVPLLGLPNCQGQFVETIAYRNPKVILVLINGGPVSIPNLYTNPGVVGIIEAFYPGALGAQAITEVLFGDYNPGGKMPVSVYSSVNDLPPVTEYGMSDPPPGRTHRYSQIKPLFPFGFGLSYSQFKFTDFSLSSKSPKACDNLTVSVTVTNISPDRPGDEVVQVYLLIPPISSSKPYFPNVQLVGFKRIHLIPGSPQKVTFVINPYLMSLADDDGVHYIFGGVGYTIRINEKDMGYFILDTGQNSYVEVSKCTYSPKCLAC